MAPAITRLASARVRVMGSILSGQELTRMLALVESPADLVTQILLQRNAARRGLGRRVRSEASTVARSSAKISAPAALSSADATRSGMTALRSQMDVDVLAKGADRQKGGATGSHRSFLLAGDTSQVTLGG